MVQFQNNEFEANNTQIDNIQTDKMQSDNILLSDVQTDKNQTEAVEATKVAPYETARFAPTTVESYNIVANNVLNNKRVNNQMSFTITEEQYVAAMRLHSRRSFRVLPMVVVMLALFLGLATLSLTTAIFGAALFAAYMALIVYLVRGSIKKAYRSLPQLHGDQTIQFSEEGLVWHNSYVLSKVKWPLYQKYAVDDNLYLLYQGPTIFNVVPRSAFHSQEQEDAFRMILELNVKPALPSKPNTRKRVQY